jgi:UPF0716 family protein affecting phage T7 exclusion
MENRFLIRLVPLLLLALPLVEIALVVLGGQAVGVVPIAGALLILPGYFSDFCGLLLLLPPIRRLILSALGARVTVAGAPAYRPGNEPPRVVDLRDDDWRPR